MGKKWLVNLACDSDSHENHRVLLHAANMRHGTYGFTSPPKEGMLWIFSPKNPTASAGFEHAILGTRDQQTMGPRGIFESGKKGEQVRVQLPVR
jgi:hypothetical protein